MHLVKKKINKNILRGKKRHRLSEKQEAVLFSEMGKILSVDGSKRDQKDCMYVVAWVKPTDFSGLTSFGFYYFNQAYCVHLCNNIK